MARSREVFELAALPGVEALSFGLMDFVSAHNGAIPDTAMRSPGQFDHPLVRRAKLEIAAACHAHGKVPSHNVSTEVRDMSVVANDAARARNEFGYTRMWSIHPDQIQPIVEAFSPRAEEIATSPLRSCSRRRPRSGARRAIRTRCTIARAIAITGRCCAARKPRVRRCRKSAAPLFGPANPPKCSERKLNMTITARPPRRYDANA